MGPFDDSGARVAPVEDDPTTVKVLGARPRERRPLMWEEIDPEPKVEATPVQALEAAAAPDPDEHRQAGVSQIAATIAAALEALDGRRSAVAWMDSINYHDQVRAAVNDAVRALEHAQSLMNVFEGKG